MSFNSHDPDQITTGQKLKEFENVINSKMGYFLIGVSRFDGGVRLVQMTDDIEKGLAFGVIRECVRREPESVPALLSFLRSLQAFATIGIHQVDNELKIKSANN